MVRWSRPGPPALLPVSCLWCGVPVLDPAFSALQRRGCTWQGVNTRTAVARYRRPAPRGTPPALPVKRSGRSSPRAPVPAGVGSARREEPRPPTVPRLRLPRRPAARSAVNRGRASWPCSASCGEEIFSDYILPDIHGHTPGHPSVSGHPILFQDIHCKCSRNPK